MNKKVIGIVLLVLVAFAVATAGFVYMVTAGRSSSRDIAENVQVSAEWKEFPVDPPLALGKQVQSIVLVVDDARFSTNRKETYLPNGAIVRPDVELRDKSGTWHTLGSFGGTVADYDSSNGSFAQTSTELKLNGEGLRGDEEFVAVRIRNAEPLTCSKIRWHTYYMK